MYGRTQVFCVLLLLSVFLDILCISAQLELRMDKSVLLA